MCNIQTLAYSENGYIIRCPECERIQLSFGMLALTLKKKQLFRLQEQVHALLNCPEPLPVFPAEKSVSIPVSASVMLCLNTEELYALGMLTGQAAALMEVYEMLS